MSSRGKLLLLLCALLARAEGEGGWLHCERPPCAGQGQCVTDSVTCGPNLVVREGASVCDCCPGCVPPLNEGDKCPDEKKTPCQDGTLCVNNKCTKGPCDPSKVLGLWAPRCERDGSFSAVQCKGTPGSGRCFCWAPTGGRLDGQRAWENSADMHCACSVRAWRLAKEAKAADAPRCAPDGSFEKLQCARGVCWCADARTGAPDGRVVPEGAAAMLFCYNSEEVGASYRRRCDSQLAARALIEEVMSAHGTTAYGLPPVACDLDGSFGPVQQRDSGQRFCSGKDKQQLEGFIQSSTEDTPMNCNCARDRNIGMANSLVCQANGNYLPHQSQDGKLFCVDEDGYFMKTVDSIADQCDITTRMQQNYLML